ncbi:hypothetical protein BHE74_00009310 [Ensete ventricosum]|nr:hypothetical protein BHE74_00009310 [Ensete ventricosum]
MTSLLSKVVPYKPPFACPLRLIRLSSSTRTRTRAEATARMGSVMSSAPALLAALVVLSSSAVPSSPDTLYDVPQTLSGGSFAP